VAITTLDGVIAGAQAPQPFWKISATAEGAGTWHSLWAVAGTPGAGSTPPAYTAGSGYDCTNATMGALPFTNPGTGTSYLTQFAGAGATIGTLILYDRLWTCSGLTTAAATTLPITTPGTISRNYSSYIGTEIWGEVYTAPGSTTATWTVSYTNQAGTSGRTATYTHPANAETVGQMFPFTLAAGDTGVQAVASFTTSVSSGTAGSIGITVLRRIAEIPLSVANVGGVLDLGSLGFPEIKNSACLALMVQCSATNSGAIVGQYACSQG
jgi:hypothetical protein